MNRRRTAVSLAAASLAALGCPSNGQADDLPVLDAVPVQPAAAAPSTTGDRVSLGFQSTYIWQRKPGFSAGYSGLNSLHTDAETGYTLSATLFVGVRLWQNTEVFVDPEAIQGQNISGLHGLGGPSNGEAQKSGGPTPTLYLARAFVRQTIALGGAPLASEAGSNRFGKLVTARRLIITVGNLSILDVFDNNALTHDPRTEFLNWALMTHGAYDYPADTRGYTWGAAVEYYRDDWAARLGRFIGPKQSNGSSLDFNIVAHYGDVLEVEHAHQVRGRPGKIRVLGFRNHEHMGAFADAIAFANAGTLAPAQCGDRPAQDWICPVRRDQSKVGFGIGVDQAVLTDADVFLRASWNDGRTEAYSFSEIDRSFALGVVARGPAWRRPGDTVGLAWVINGISGDHRDYLRRGGIGFFLGDGQLSYRPEQLIEVYYVASLRGLWLTLDYQHVANPGYNADRGGVSFLGVRLHLEI